MRKDRLTQNKALKITEEAAEWLYELRAENSQQLGAYLDWLLESPQHVEAFLRVSAVDASLSKVDANRSIKIEQPVADTQVANVISFTADSKTGVAIAARGQTMWLPWRALAAGIAIAAVATALWMFRPGGPAYWTSYVTSIGEQRAIELADGSLLHINTNSRVQVRYSAHERSIRLLAGEALFRVQHEPSRPFRVHSGNAVVQAIGTEFNILRKSGASMISVLEGRVRVEVPAAPNNAMAAQQPGSQSTSGTRTRSSGDKMVLLAAGEEVGLTDSGNISAQRKANLTRINAWRQRRLVFMNDTLSAIAAEFNRYNRRPQIKVEGPAATLRDYETMSFEADDPESFLAVLAKDPKLQLEREDNTVTVKQRIP